MADVFLSFSPEDSSFADRIARGLDRAGLTVARTPAAATDQWQRRLYDSIDEASAVVVLWSRASVNREWVQMEAAVGQQFAQLVSVRIDPELPITDVPVEYRDPQTGEITEIFESELAGNNWGGSAQDALDRRLASVCGRIRHLKARGPAPSHAVANAGLAHETEVARVLREGFTWRRAGAERNAAMPALAATRRETAFRAAYTALGGIEHPAQIRVGLSEFVDPATARRGLARLYNEAQQRNDPDFWGHVARLAMPISPTLTAAALQRAGLRGDVLNDLMEPRDSKEMHAERTNGAAKGRASVVAWPIAAVAAGLVAFAAAPFVNTMMRNDAPQAEVAAPEAAPAIVRPAEPQVQVASAEDAIDRGAGPRIYDPKAFAPPPWAKDAGEPTIVQAPPVPKMHDGPIIPASTQPVATTPAATPAIAKTTVTATASAPRAVPAPAPAPTATAPQSWSIPIPALTEAQNRLRLCRAQAGATEQTVEVLSDESFMDVAWRMNISDPAMIRSFKQRNEACLNTRQLVLSDGTQITGANLLFPGDVLVVPTLFGATTPTHVNVSATPVLPDPNDGWVLLPEGWTPTETSKPTVSETPTWSAAPPSGTGASAASHATMPSSLPYFPTFTDTAAQTVAPAQTTAQTPVIVTAPTTTPAATWSLEPKDVAVTTGERR